MGYQRSPFLIILSAPSGGGKSTILAEILKIAKNIEYSVSYTTRKPRGTEQNGIHYHFVTEEEFKKRITVSDFLEYAVFSGNHYGTSASYIRSRLAEGQHVIMDIDVQGAAQIGKIDIPYVKIFIMPPSLQVLKERLVKRNTDTAEEIENRLKIAREEIGHISEYDYLVINDDLQVAVDTVWSVIQAEENRITRYRNPAQEFSKGE